VETDEVKVFAFGSSLNHVVIAVGAIIEKMFPNVSVDVLAIRSCPQMLRICSFFLKF